MTMKVKLIGQIFLIHFSLIGVLLLLTFIKFIINSQTHGGEMGDTIFLFILILVTFYYTTLTLWTYRIYKQSNVFNASIIIKYTLIFIFGICSSIWGLNLII
jgi:hypothetical protein